MPGNHIKVPLGTKQHGTQVVKGSFAPNGSSALVATSTRGERSGFTVAYISTGLYRITFEDAWQAVDVDSKWVSLQLATTDDKYLVFGPFVAGSATAGATLDILSRDIGGAGLADIAADANNRIDFGVVFDTAPRRVT